MMDAEGLFSLSFCVSWSFSDPSPTAVLLIKEIELYNTQASNVVAAMSLHKTLQSHNTNVFSFFAYCKNFSPLVPTLVVKTSVTLLNNITQQGKTSLFTLCLTLYSIMSLG